VSHRRKPGALRAVLLLVLAVLAGHFSPALCGQARQDSRAPVPPGQAAGHMAQGMQAFEKGDLAEAIRQWEAAAGFYEGQARPLEQADALYRIAGAYRSLGHYPRALNSLYGARDLAKAQNDRTLLAKVLGGLGQLCHFTGQFDKAEAYLQKSLALAGQASSPHLVATILNDYGNYLAAVKQHDRALAAYTECIGLCGQAHEPELAARARINAAKVFCEQKDHESAGTLLEAALREMQSHRDSREKAYALIAIGQLFSRVRTLQVSAAASGSHALSLAYQAFTEAQGVAARINNPSATSYALGYLGQLYEKEHRYEEALRLTRQAVFAAQTAQAPEVLYRWHWQTGRLLSARKDIPGAICAYKRAVHDLQIIKEDLASDCKEGVRLSFRDVVGPLYFELADLLLRHSALRQDPGKAQEDLAQAQSTIELLKAVELQDYFEDECVTYLQERITTLDTAEPHAAAIYPILLPDRTELLVTLPGSIKRFTVAIGTEALTLEVNWFRSKLEQPWSRYLRHARRLYEWLVSPIEEELKNQGIETIVFVPDGILRTIPLAALHDGDRFLIERFAIVTTPGLTLTDPHPLRRKDILLLLSGLTKPVQGFPALSNVSHELESVQRLFHCTVLKDDDFTVGAVENTLSAMPYRLVHIASHGQFHRDPQKTFLLTYDGRLTMDDLERIMGLTRFRETPVELLTLSACQTAAGDDRAALGLAGVALRAGARSAVASLWFIDDEATSQLIAEFYRQLRDPSLSKAQALRNAQALLLRSERYAHPAYWAAFLLIGNWL